MRMSKRGRCKTTARLKPSARHTYRQLLDYQMLPRFERASLASIDTLLVREWLAALVEAELSPSRIRNDHQVPSQVLATAVEANRLGRKSGQGVRLPRIVRRRCTSRPPPRSSSSPRPSRRRSRCWSASMPTPACGPVSWPHFGWTPGPTPRCL